MLTSLTISIDSLALKHLQAANIAAIEAQKDQEQQKQISDKEFEEKVLDREDKKIKYLEEHKYNDHFNITKRLDHLFGLKCQANWQLAKGKYGNHPNVGMQAYYRKEIENLTNLEDEFKQKLKFLEKENNVQLVSD